MKVKINGKPSFSKDKKRAQVMVLVGEGKNRQSVTRHIVRQGNMWVGLNPDERAITMNAHYEAELADAKSNLAATKRELTKLREKLAEVEENETPAENIVDTTMLNEIKTELVELIGEMQAMVNFAESEVNNAKSKLAIVQWNLPLEVEFVGANL